MIISKSIFASSNRHGYVVTQTEGLESFRDVIALRLRPGEPT